MTDGVAVWQCLAIVLWVFCGFTGFVFWWTRDFAITLGSLFLCLYAGIVGPFSWILGWIIHGEPFNRNYYTNNYGVSRAAEIHGMERAARIAESLAGFDPDDHQAIDLGKRRAARAIRRGAMKL